jgi:uncharacterized protein (TIRG00374 family)
VRKFFVALLILIGVIFVIGRFAELQSIFETLKRGDWRFLVIALGVQLAWLFNIAMIFRVIYRALGIEEKMTRLAMMSAAATFANVVAPSVGMSGVAVFISEARRKGYSPARATLAGVLYILFDYAGFLCVLTLGLIVLFRRNDLNLPELIASFILFLLAMVIASLLYLGMRSAETLGSVLAWMARQVNRVLFPFLHRQYLSEQRAIEFAHDAAEGLRELQKKPKDLILPLLLALSSKTLLILVLFLMFMAFKVPLSIGTLIAGFSIGYLFLIISPTPAGLGFVESGLTLALASMYVPLSAAAVIVIAYRGYTFWLPFAIGGIALRWLNRD